MTGTATGAEAGTRMRTGIGTRTGMGARTRAGTRIERRGEGKGSLGTYEIVIEVDRETREGGRHQGVTSSHSHKTRRPSNRRDLNAM